MTLTTQTTEKFFVCRAILEWMCVIIHQSIGENFTWNGMDAIITEYDDIYLQKSKHTKCSSDRSLNPSRS